MCKIKPRESQNVEYKSSWHDKLHIQMRVWNDYIEIWNSGELPVGYTSETLYGNHSSQPRNKNIANAFFKAGFIDAWGRGYKKISEGFEGAGLPMPKVENFCGGVRVTLQRKNVPESALKSVEKVWGLMKENPYITTKQIADTIGLTIRGVEENIKKLKKCNRIRRIGGDKGGHWEVISTQ